MSLPKHAATAIFPKEIRDSHPQPTPQGVFFASTPTHA